MENPNLKYDYSICDDCLIVNSINVEQSFRRQGIASSFLKRIELIAKEKQCKSISTPADLSKIALSFWIKNGYHPTDEDAKRKIDYVLNSKQDTTFLFDIEDNSVVELYKQI